MNFEIYRERNEKTCFFDYLFDIEEKLKDISFKYNIIQKGKTVSVFCTWNTKSKKEFKAKLEKHRMFSGLDLVPASDYVQENGFYCFNSYYIESKEVLFRNISEQICNSIKNVPCLGKTDKAFINLLGRGLWLNCEED